MPMAFNSLYFLAIAKLGCYSMFPVLGILPSYCILLWFCYNLILVICLFMHHLSSIIKQLIFTHTGYLDARPNQISCIYSSSIFIACIVSYLPNSFYTKNNDICWNQLVTGSNMCCVQDRSNWPLLSVLTIFYVSIQLIFKGT